MLENMQTHPQDINMHNIDIIVGRESTIAPDDGHDTQDTRYTSYKVYDTPDTGYVKQRRTQNIRNTRHTKHTKSHRRFHIKQYGCTYGVPRFE